MYGWAVPRPGYYCNSGAWKTTLPKLLRVAGGWRESCFSALGDRAATCHLHLPWPPFTQPTSGLRLAVSTVDSKEEQMKVVEPEHPP